MTDSPRDTYIAAHDRAFAPAILALDEAIMAVRPDFDVRISYGILMYALDADFRRWVCAIDCGKATSSKRTVWVRFLYGTALADPKGLLRHGTSHLSTLDFASPDDVDPELVAGYVREAAARHAELKAQAISTEGA
jgi:hypothetical protein